MALFLSPFRSSVFEPYLKERKMLNIFKRISFPANHRKVRRVFGGSGIYPLLFWGIRESGLFEKSVKFLLLYTPFFSRFSD